MTAQQDRDRDQAASDYDADLHHLNLLAGEPDGANPWPGIIALIGAVALACIVIFAAGCRAPSRKPRTSQTTQTTRPPR